MHLWLGQLLRSTLASPRASLSSSTSICVLQIKRNRINAGNESVTQWALPVNSEPLIDSTFLRRAAGEESCRPSTHLLYSPYSQSLRDAMCARSVTIFGLQPSESLPRGPRVGEFDNPTDKSA